MQKITPHLWYDKEAIEAANFYVSIFGGDSKVNNVKKITGTPSGDCDIVSFKLWGYEFMAISAGPYFKPTPSISFMINFDPSQDKDAVKKIDELWEKLADGGKVMMGLDEYQFSKRYGWLADKYGFSWQLILTNPAGEARPPIIPALLFVGDKYGKAEQASDFYISIFKDTRRGVLTKYQAGSESNKEGTVMFTDFKLEGQWFVAMDGGGNHDFGFNESVSFIVNCEDQKELDYYWKNLSAVPEAERCGWLKDRYGVSWQIVPQEMNLMLSKSTPEQMARVTKAFLPMKKFDLAVLRQAYEGT